MPSPSSNASKIYLITNISTGTNVVTISPNSAETFGAKSLAALHLSTVGEAWKLQSDGTNWMIVAHYCNTTEASYVPTIGSSGTPPTIGTTTQNIIRWSRIGNKMRLTYAFIQTVAGSSNGTGVYLWPLPSGYTIDTTAQPVSTAAGQNTVGWASMFETGWTSGVGSVQAYNSSNLALQAQGLATLSGGGVIPFNQSAAVFQIQFVAEVPIANWEP